MTKAVAVSNKPQQGGGTLRTNSESTQGMVTPDFNRNTLEVEAGRSLNSSQVYIVRRPPPHFLKKKKTQGKNREFEASMFSVLGEFHVSLDSLGFP